MKKANTRIPKLEKSPSTCLRLNIMEKTNVAIDKRRVLIKSAANTPNRILTFLEDVQMENEVDIIKEKIKVRYTAKSTKIPLFTFTLPLFFTYTNRSSDKLYCNRS